MALPLYSALVRHISSDLSRSGLPHTRETLTYWGIRKGRKKGQVRLFSVMTRKRHNRQWAKIKMQGIPLKSNGGKKKLWLTADWNQLARGAIFGDSQNSARQHPLQPVLGDCLELDDVGRCFFPHLSTISVIFSINMWSQLSQLSKSENPIQKHLAISMSVIFFV